MTRTAPPAPQWTPPTQQEREEITLTIKTITPLFGGGYEAGVVDSEHPIHASGIRGSLRFWWRATTGAMYATLDELYTAEEALWGSADTYGEVALKVDIVQPGVQKQCGKFVQRRDGTYPGLPTFEQNWPPYALQPFQGKSTRDYVETEPATALLNASFRLSLRLPQLRQSEVLLAVKAWILYGGIGARTRRGCGSLATDYDFPVLDLPEANAPELLTVLQGATCLKGNSGNYALLAWNNAVTLYRDFRQSVNFARNAGNEVNRPGRSRWSEPDTIRNITGQRARLHQPLNLPEGFPRADLGLPIIFHFQGGGDPGDTTLQVNDDKRTRFASPVITKAIQLPNGTYQPTLLILNAPHVWELGDLDLNGNRVTQAHVEMVPADRARIHPLTGAGLPVREALLEYARTTRGWTEGTIL